MGLGQRSCIVRCSDRRFGNVPLDNVGQHSHSKHGGNNGYLIYEMLQQVKLSSGHKACPSCGSDSWKGAKLVVLEGTSTSNGTMSGSMTDPGRLSGNMSDFFLSDRWFSFKHPLELNTEGIAQTALSTSIKDLLCSEGKLIKPAVKGIPPAKPPDIRLPMALSFLERSFLERNHAEGEFEAPPAPAFPSLGRFLRNWFFIRFAFVCFLMAILFVLSDPFLISVAQRFAGSQFYLVLSFVARLGASEQFSQSASAIILAIAPIIVLLSIDLPLDLMRRKKVWEAAYEKKVSRLSAVHEALSEKRSMLLEKSKDVDLDLNRYKVEKAAHEKQMEEYRRKVSEAEAQYAQECNRVAEERLALWDRTRVCMRCGTAYLS
jgi:Skp family chaperone for outer membrane proteins